MTVEKRVNAKGNPLCAWTLKSGDLCASVAIAPSEYCKPHAAKAEAMGPSEPVKIEGAADFASEHDAVLSDSGMELLPSAPESLSTPVESLRSELRAGLVTSETVELIRENIIAGLRATKDTWLTCTHCKHRSPVQVADLGTRVSAAEKLLDQIEGKLRAEGQTVEQKLEEARTRAKGDLESLSDEELVLLALDEDAPSPKQLAHDLAAKLVKDRAAGRPAEWLAENLSADELSFLRQVVAPHYWTEFPDGVYDLAERVIAA